MRETDGCDINSEGDTGDERIVPTGGASSEGRGGWAGMGHGLGVFLELFHGLDGIDVLTDL